jgi:hypothetical protein
VKERLSFADNSEASGALGCPSALQTPIFKNSRMATPSRPGLLTSSKRSPPGTRGLAPGLPLSPGRLEPFQVQQIHLRQRDPLATKLKVEATPRSKVNNFKQKPKNLLPEHFKELLAKTQYEVPLSIQNKKIRANVAKPTDIVPNSDLIDDNIYIESKYEERSPGRQARSSDISFL